MKRFCQSFVLVTSFLGITAFTATPSLALVNGDGNILNKFSNTINSSCRQKFGRFICYLLDPPPTSGIKELGVEIKYDPNKVKILLDQSGFLCEFSLDGSCPNAPIIPAGEIVELGQPRSGTSFTLSSTIDTIFFHYDLSNNPTPPIPRETFFFGIGLEPLTNELLTTSDFVQANVVCITTANEQCREAVPEPSSTLGLLALGTLGAGLTLLRKQKQHRSAIALTNDAQ